MQDQKPPEVDPEAGGGTLVTRNGTTQTEVPVDDVRPSNDWSHYLDSIPKGSQGTL